MKKILILALASTLFFASCTNVKSDAEKICLKLTEIADAQKTKDTSKLASLQKEYDAEMELIRKKYAAGSDAAKEFESMIKPCIEEAEKAEIKADADIICNMMNEGAVSIGSNDIMAFEAFQKKYEPIVQTMEKKYPDGSAQAKELDGYIETCLEDAVKAAEAK
jgi:hypothetical protein